MCLLFETIKIADRVPFNIDGHQRRVDAARRALFGACAPLDLRAVVVVPADLDAGLHRCRVEYDTEIRGVEFIPYAPRALRTLRLRTADDLVYDRKYVDRARLDVLRRDCGADDALIVRDGCITDLTHANVVLFDGVEWSTPDRPLLDGTKRRQLLERGAIREARITPHDLGRYTCLAPINAMLDIGDVPFIPIANILAGLG